MDERSNFWSRSTRYSDTIRLGQGYETEKMSYWSRWWMRFIVRKENLPRRRFLFKSGSVRVQSCYDEYSYSQNFDEGPAMDDPDCLSRSFSTRFSNSSRKQIVGLSLEQVDGLLNKKGLRFT
ncbi:hypothetical protein QQ045_022054 [Rhodiola kirilowii]